MIYDISKRAGGEARKSTIHSRLKMFTMMEADNRINSPGPQDYVIKQHRIIKSTPKISFGRGNKFDFTYNR